ncbi:MAG: hypothetical protein L3K16_07135 [Thermoplasmata archaeon]|nr:hypothetical protein [Thermoplasmata archaeon]
MSRPLATGLLFAVVAVVLLSVSPGLAQSAVLSPTVRAASVPTAPAVPLAALGVAAAAAVPATTPASGAPSCPTPQNPGHWNSLLFFNDVEVSFYVPGSPGLDHGGFNMEPCGNNLPMNLNGFYMNITTNVKMVNAVVTIWGTSWSIGSGVPPIIKGFDPLEPAQLTGYINPNGPGTTASFYFDLYRYFLPGSQVYFNLTVQSASATPSTIYSTSGGNYAKYNDSGLIDNWTWGFSVDSPWASTSFLSDIRVSTTPNVLSQPAYDPNRNQSLGISLTSISYINGSLQAIPKATLNLSETVDGITTAYGEAFSPLNATYTNLTIPPNPESTKASFNITAYLVWKGGSIDRIVSPTYTFAWSSHGGWWYPSLGLVRNLNITTTPNVLAATGTKTTLATGTQVNVTIHEPIQNVTFGQAQVRVTYSDAAGVASAVLPMTRIGANTSFALIPGLPSGGTVAFYLIVKDIFGTPLASGNWTYTETGAPAAGPGGLVLAAGYGMFFFEAVDLSTGHLVSFLNYTLANATWSESRQGTALGFAAPTPLAGTGYLPVTFGTYIVTIHAFNQTQAATVSVSSSTPFELIFYVASGAVAQTSWVQQTTFTIPAILGLGAAALAFVPVSAWFRERRKKAEQEQRRITL